MSEALTVQPEVLRTPEECIARLRGSSPDWADRAGIWSTWVFRGVGDSRYALLPSALREPGSATLEPLRARVSAIVDAWVERNQRGKRPSPDIKADDGSWVRGSETVVRQIGAEFGALNVFIQLADQQQFGIEQVRTARSAVEHVLDGGLAHIRELSNEYNRPIVAIAQHHRIPTRLLDWTREPLYGLWFAASSAMRGRKRAEPATHFTVWALNLKGLDNPQSPLQIIEIASHHDRFINAQHGLFIFDRYASEDFYRYRRWKTLDETLLSMAASGWQEISREPLRRFDIPVEIAQGVVELLFKERVHGAALQPTLDNVAHEAKARWLGYSPS